MVIVCEAITGDTIKFGLLEDGQPYPDIKELGKKFEKKILTYKLHNLSNDITKAEHQTWAGARSIGRFWGNHL